MESALRLEIVTPDRSVLDTEASYVGMPGTEGQFGVLPNHVPLMSALTVGKLYFRHNAMTETLFIANGFVEVAENRVTVLTEAAEKASDIDTNRALEAKKRAEERLASKESVDIDRAKLALSRAIGRLRVVGAL